MLSEKDFGLSRRDQLGRISVSQMAGCRKDLALGATNSFTSKAALLQPLALIIRLYYKLFRARNYLL